MNPALQNASRSFISASVAVLVVFAPPPLIAQLVSLKTAPIATGEQYVVFPSRTLGMGGVSFAMRDPLADPFRNPARGIWTTATHVFAGPTFYDISEEGRDAGAGTTISAGAVVRGRSIFGGGAFTVQQLDDPFESRNVLTGEGSLEDPRDNHYLQLRFNGRMVNKGFVGFWHEDATAVFAPVPGRDFVIARAQPGKLPDFRVSTTQFSIVVPFGAQRAPAHES